MAKRRPAGDGMVRKREDGRWEGRIVIGHKENGEPLFRHVYAKTQKTLLDKLHQNIECYRDVELTEDSRMTLGEWLDRWLTGYKAGTVRPGTLKSYRCYIEYYIKPQLGDKQISLISQQDIQRMYRHLKTEGRIHEHPEMDHQLSDSMVRHIHSTLHAALKDAVQAHVIIFTTMQKFEESNEALSERRNIIVMADEAHRGQYGLNEKVVVKQKDNGEVEAKTVIGTARIIRDTLPNATYIGFTGTPISTKDRSTREVFGDYIDIYVGRKRRSGTGCVSEINDHLFEGRYSPKWPDGKKHARNIYAHTREECEEKLKVLIVEMKAEIAVAQRLKDEGKGDGSPPKEKKGKRGKKRT